MFANIAQPIVQFAAPAIRSGAQDAIRCLSATTVLTGVVAGIGVISLAAAAGGTLAFRGARSSYTWAANKRSAPIALPPIPGSVAEEPTAAA
jgi:hypothetical protein